MIVSTHTDLFFLYKTTFRDSPEFKIIWRRINLPDFLDKFHILFWWYNSKITLESNFTFWFVHTLIYQVTHKCKLRPFLSVILLWNGMLFNNQGASGACIYNFNNKIHYKCVDLNKFPHWSEVGSWKYTTENAIWEVHKFKKK